MDLTAGKVNVASSGFHDAAASTDFSASLLVRTLHDLAPSSQSPACYGTWMAYLLRSAAHTGKHSNKHCTQRRFSMTCSHTAAQTPPETGKL
jgi:hypothetical protein